MFHLFHHQNSPLEILPLNHLENQQDNQPLNRQEYPSKDLLLNQQEALHLNQLKLRQHNQVGSRVQYQLVNRQDNL
jgi:hypothetical protein